MIIFKTKKGTIGLMSKTKLAISLAKGKIKIPYNREIKEKIIKRKDIVGIYDLGYLHSVLMNEQEICKKLFEKTESKHKKNAEGWAMKKFNKLDFSWVLR